MSKRNINSKELKSIITEMQTGSKIYTLLPVSWGFWNAMACILSIFKIFKNEDIIWLTMVICGMISHIIIFAVQKKNSGFILKMDNALKWFWIIIVTAIINICFILPVINNFYNTEYSIVFAIILVGSGIFFTGIIYKLKTWIIFGAGWIVSANIITAFINYRYHIYLILVVITLIIRPLIWYFFEKGKYNAR